MTEDSVLEGEVIESEKPAKSAKSAKLPKKYKVMFHESDGDKSDIVLVHNYVTNVYQRGKWVEIDENFLGVLRDAKLETTRVMRDAHTGENVNDVTSRPAIQYSVELA